MAGRVQEDTAQPGAGLQNPDIADPSKSGEDPRNLTTGRAEEDLSRSRGDPWNPDGKGSRGRPK